MPIIKWLSWLCLGSVLTACSSTLPQKDLLPVDTQALMVIDLRQTRTLQQILPELIQQQVVLVGESHTEYAHHLQQLALIKALHPYWPDMGIGIEYVQRPFQPVLDAYIAGTVSEAQMLKKTQWYQRWGYDFRLYRGLFQYAREHNIPLVALNASRELTKAVRKSGIEALPVEYRRHLPGKITRSAAYRDRLAKVYQRHAKGSLKGLDAFVDVQLTWDESMAANAAAALRSKKIKHMVLLAGSGHVLRQAIPVRLKKYGYRSRVLLQDLPDHLSDADFIIPVRRQKLSPSGKIGIMMKQGKQGVTVAGVTKAHTAGLQKGDIILSINGLSVQAPEDISIELLNKRPGEVLSIVIKRASKRLKKRIKLL